MLYVGGITPVPYVLLLILDLAGNFLQVDLDCPNEDLFPRLASTGYLETVLAPGHMIYIPPYWWHYVKSLDISFSVSFWWK